MPTCCFPLFLICLLLFIYIFIQLVLFCLHVGSFSFLFQMCSSQGSGANSLPHSRIICSLGLAASRKQCLHQKQKLPFVLIWLILSTGSFGLCLTVFATCLPIRFMLRPTYSAWFWSKSSFSCTSWCLLYRLSSTLGQSAEGFSSYLFFYESSKTDQFRDGACVAIAWSNQKGVFSNTLLPQRLILMRICRCLELYRLLDLLPKSGVKARATAEPRRSLRTLLKTYQTFPV